ncbi:translation initiation factor IF-2-like [Panthera pardus]|uniref:Translation initiation factor IF-2-like n=1 Tax=Panthera pardus TaxID=9691 RepID=A0A9V1EWC5_PANPR|nr:translation initiation factor IF-2-like [Panthera pardus]
MFSCCVPVFRGCWLRGAPGRDAPRPWRQCRSCTGRLRSLARREPKKSTDEIGRRLSESRFTCPTEVCVCPVAQEGHPGPGERVAARRSPEAGPGDGLGGPPSPPGPFHRVLAQRSWDQDPEPPEPEPEESGAGAEAGAAPEPDPTASGASAALQAGAVSGATPAGAREPASDLGPVQGRQAPEQSQLGPASAPAASTVPAPAPNTVPATALLPAPAPTPATDIKSHLEGCPRVPQGTGFRKPLLGPCLLSPFREHSALFAEEVATIQDVSRSHVKEGPSGYPRSRVAGWPRLAGEEVPVGQDRALRQSGGSQVLPEGQVDSGALRRHHRDSSACNGVPIPVPSSAKDHGSIARGPQMAEVML